MGNRRRFDCHLIANGVLDNQNDVAQEATSGKAKINIGLVRRAQICGY